MPVRGSLLEAIDISCRKCGKHRGHYKLFGKYYNSKIENSDYGLYKVNFRKTKISEKTHAGFMLTMSLRRKFIIADSATAILKAERV